VGGLSPQPQAFLTENLNQIFQSTKNTMLYVGNTYIVKFPFGESKIMTLQEVHNPQHPHETLYTFIDSSNMKVSFSKSVCSRITFQYNFNFDLPPVPFHLRSSLFGSIYRH